MERGRARVAVIGTGMMGPGIAITLALAGHPVTLFGRSADSVPRGLAAVDRGLQQLRDERLTTARSAHAAQRRIHGSTDLAAAVGQAAFVFESVIEELDLKQQLFRQLDQLAPRQAI